MHVLFPTAVCHNVFLLQCEHIVRITANVNLQQFGGQFEDIVDQCQLFFLVWFFLHFQVQINLNNKKRYTEIRYKIELAKRSTSLLQAKLQVDLFALYTSYL